MSSGVALLLLTPIHTCGQPRPMWTLLALLTLQGCALRPFREQTLCTRHSSGLGTTKEGLSIKTHHTACSVFPFPRHSSEFLFTHIVSG